jgi:hypothetical protein
VLYFITGAIAGLIATGLGIGAYLLIAKRRDEKRILEDVNYCIVLTRERVWDLYNFLRCSGVPRQVNLAEWEEVLRAMRSVKAWDKKVREGRRDSVPPFASRR